MGKLRRLSGAEVMKLLEEQGFAEARRRGSHAVMPRIADGETVTVFVPDHNEVRVGALRSIIRQSGLERELFEVD